MLYLVLFLFCYYEFIYLAMDFADFVPLLIEGRKADRVPLPLLRAVCRCNPPSLARRRLALTSGFSQRARPGAQSRLGYVPPALFAEAFSKKQQAA
jgi:hypothetical protein